VCSWMALFPPLFALSLSLFSPAPPFLGLCQRPLFSHLFLFFFSWTSWVCRGAWRGSEGVLSFPFRLSPLSSVRLMRLSCSVSSCVGVAAFSLFTLWAQLSFSLLAVHWGLLGPFPLVSSFRAGLCLSSRFFSCPYQLGCPVSLHVDGRFPSTPWLLLGFPVLLLLFCMLPSYHLLNALLFFVFVSRVKILRGWYVLVWARLGLLP